VTESALDAGRTPTLRLRVDGHGYRELGRLRTSSRS
jgi:hypothetical protein